MSNYLAIAVVTAAFQELVQGALQDVVPGLNVRVGPPRAIATGEREVNLYLYQVTPNAQLRNNDLPRWGNEGALIVRPQTAVDLHYIISFAGEDRLATELMLGKVVSILGAIPQFGRGALRHLVRADGSYPYLAGSDLDRQPDLVELSPVNLSFDELAKLWTVFFQIAHRPSLLYVASPVMLEAEIGDVWRGKSAPQPPPGTVSLELGVAGSQAAPEIIESRLGTTQAPGKAPEPGGAP